MEFVEGKGRTAVGTRSRSIAEATAEADTKTEAVQEAAIKIKHVTPAAHAANLCMEILQGEQRSLALNVTLK